MSFSKNARYGLLVISLMVVIFDQISKYYVRKSIDLYAVKPVIANCWNWTLSYNQGAAFGFLNNTASILPTLFFACISIVVGVGIGYFILSKEYSRITGIAFSFILGGAIGNLIDRLAFGKVTDFIQWYYGTYYWPNFNLADSFVCIGVALLLIERLFFSKNIT